MDSIDTSCYVGTPPLAKKVKVIAICGKAESGKDTLADAISAELEANRKKKTFTIHFADVLKYVARQYYHWDEQKNDKGRTLLQELGQGLRERNYEPAWREIVSILIKTLGPEVDYIIVPDMRYKEEYKILKDNFDLTTIKVRRFDGVRDDNGFLKFSLHSNALSQKQQEHKSETDLDSLKTDYVFCNWCFEEKELDGSYFELFITQVQQMVSDIIGEE